MNGARCIESSQPAPAIARFYAAGPADESSSAPASEDPAATDDGEGN